MRPGDLIANRFRIESSVGAGATSEVFRALDREAGGPVAVKIVRLARRADAERFAREVQILAEVHHPGIVGHVDHGALGGREAYLVMEWIEGETLETRLRRATLTPAECIVLGIRLAEALGAVHRLGVVHRDVKPVNVMLPDGDLASARLLDFGVARNDGAATLTAQGSIVGTPGFIAPEQARGEPDVDVRADVYSLGVVLFTCLTGSCPFLGNGPVAALLKTVAEPTPHLRDVSTDVPLDFADLVAQMMAKSRDDRPADGAAVADALRRIDANAAAREAAPAITHDEQRWMFMVLAGRDENERADAVRAALDAAHGEVQQLANGSLLVAIECAGTPTDEGTRAARCALELQRARPSAPVALAAAWGSHGAHARVGELIDRATEMFHVSSAPSRAVRVDDVAAGLLDARFVVRSHAEGLVLLGEREVATARRTVLGISTPCVGRAHEIGMLRAAFDATVAGPRAHAWLLTGAPGAGKSRLRVELLEQLRAAHPPFEVWFASGDPGRAATPFGLLADMLRAAAGVREGETPSMQQTRFTARFERSLATRRAINVERTLGFLSELARLPSAVAFRSQLDVVRRDARLMGDLLRRAWTDLLEAECAKTPLLLVIDDLQWGDASSIAFLDATLRALRARPFMVLALARPEVHETFPRLWRERDLNEIRLAPLGRDASEQLVHAVLGDELDPAAVSLVVERAGGNPYYLEELIRSTAKGSVDALPDTVVAMAHARLEHLEPFARRVLRAASVFNDVFWHGSVAALLGHDVRGDELDHWLATLVDRELITPRPTSRFVGEDEYAFAHALLREAAYSSFTDADRTLGHQLAAEWLEARGEADVLVIAEHFERGGLASRAVRGHLHAAEQSLQGDDFVNALAFAARGLASASDADPETVAALRCVQAQAHRWRSEHVECEHAAEAALAKSARASVSWWQAVSELAIASGALGRLDRIDALATAVREELEAGAVSSPAIIAAARLGMQLHFAGRHVAAEQLFDAMEQYGSELCERDPLVRARVAQTRAPRAVRMGDHEASLQWRREAVQSFLEAGDERDACNAQINIGYGYILLGDYDAAEVALRPAMETADRIGLPTFAATARQNLGAALAGRGRLDEAIAVEREAIEMFTAGGDVRMEAMSRVYLARILVASGALDDALAEVERASEKLTDRPPLHAWARTIIADIWLAKGDVARARPHAEAAAAVLDDVGTIEEGEAQIRVVYAIVRLDRGDREGAAKTLEAGTLRILERAHRLEDPALRRGFTERIVDHARLLALAAHVQQGL